MIIRVSLFNKNFTLPHFKQKKKTFNYFKKDALNDNILLI